jgi:hypothetical protein
LKVIPVAAGLPYINFYGNAINFLCFVFLFIKPRNVNAQTQGCTDPQADNFNATATINNGSCKYTITSYLPGQRAKLNTTLKEISGIVYFNDKLLALNDGGGGNKLYVLDTASGDILQTITVSGATNVDWEDMAQDSNYIYVGDIGNNASGNRKNLCIYKIDKSAFQTSGDYTIPESDVQKINYSYPEQTNFAAAAPNTTKFDCESLIAHRGKLHLFTKDWTGGYAVHYSLPIDSGTYVATRLDSLNTNGYLLTGADAGAYDEILFTSYDKSGNCALFLVFGYNDTDNFFDTGNKREIALPFVLTTGQIESVCFVNSVHGFFASEYFKKSIFTVTNKLSVFTSAQWILDYYKQNPKLAEKGMLRFNTDTDKYEVFTGLAWENLN